jgi:hypothetical protein
MELARVRVLEGVHDKGRVLSPDTLSIPRVRIPALPTEYLIDRILK